MNQRIIAHLDMDAFFASVEEVATPRFKGKPIVVGSEIINGVGRGVVSTANYKAREYGIHSAMPIMTAWRLSEQAKKQGKEEAIFLGVDFPLYNRVSEKGTSTAIFIIALASVRTVWHGRWDAVRTWFWENFPVEPVVNLREFGVIKFFIIQKEFNGEIEFCIIN